MFTVIKLGGCNGSGKTSVAKALIKLTKGAPIETKLLSGKRTDVHVGLYNGTPVHVLGRYENACGGMDTISDKYDRFELVRKAVLGDNRYTNGLIVFFEGLITGKTYGALGELSEQHYKRKAGRWLYAFMDTPFDVCVERVGQRRAAAGKGMEGFDPERTMRPTFNSCLHLAEKLMGERVGRTPIPSYHHVMMLDHSKKPATLAKQLLARAMEIQCEGF